MKKENPRLDAVTRKPYPKSELLRIALVSGVVTPDPKGELPGRGLYILRDPSSLQLAIKRKVFERAFRRPLTEEERLAIQEAL